MEISDTNHRIKVRLCLCCGDMLDCATQIVKEDRVDEEPTPGDYSVCLKCGYVMVFDEALNYRHPTERERLSAERDPYIANLQKLRRKLPRNS